jgi:hypothetical protein
MQPRLVIEIPWEAKMGKATLYFFITAFILFMSGCGSQSSNTTNFGPAPAVPVSLTVTDAPPAGVTVLFFQLSISSATLTSSSGDSVSLLPSNNGISEPIPVNVTQLQTDSAFLGTGPVPPGTYTGLSVTFSGSSQLTIYNGSGAAIGSCANNSVCQLTPVPAPLTLAFPSAGASSTAPFPIDLSLNSPVAFELDIHLDTVIQSDLTVNLGATNGVTISELPTPPSGAPVSALGHMIGTIQAVSPTASPNEFVLQTGDGWNFTIDVGSNTTYSDFPSSACSTGTFSCLAPQQIVRVELSLQTGGTLLASIAKYLQPAGQMVVEGNIIRLSTSGGNTLMDLIVQQGPPTSGTNAIPFGQRVTVTVPSTGVTYAVDSGSFTLPSGLSFTSAADFAVGQEVSVVVQGSVTTSGSGSSTPWTGPAVTTFTTNSITLEPSQITGTVGTVDTADLNFTFATFPNFFVPPAASASPTLSPFTFAVQTTSGTTFTNLSPDSIQGLAANDVVSVQGWLFLVPGNDNIACPVPTYGCSVYPEIAAETVVGRPGPTPLF